MGFRLKDARPIWQQLCEELAERIVTGKYAPGARFPAVRELAAEAGVNPNTMQRALSQLEADGLAVANRTAGRTVTEDAAAVEAVRRKLAAENAAVYLSAMARLGYSRGEAMELLKEENHT